MSTFAKVCAAIALAFVGACAAPDNTELEEFVIIDPAPLTVEPVFNGKAK
ncbi:MAG: hypothetical protein AAGD04_03670 [Pseudomonadota bacterium]